MAADNDQLQTAMLPAVLLMGPTASGKTRLAVELAQRLNGEIISVDSAQVYRGMDIGTAKPDASERDGVPHHLIDILDPAEPYSAARFREDAIRLVGEIRTRGRVPLLAGGTMLYFRALTQGLSALPSANDELRKELQARAEKLGWPELHRQLADRDPESAARLHPNDSQRILRALEIVELTGQTVADAQRCRSDEGLEGPLVRIGLWLDDRAALHSAIEARFMAMMARGFLEEVQGLHRRGDLSAEMPSMRAVGYRQLWAHLEGAWDLQTAVQRGITATRRLAKRQFTWLRSMPENHLLAADSDTLADRAEALVRGRRTA